jgi:hypothetical protein
VSGDSMGLEALFDEKRQLNHTWSKRSFVNSGCSLHLSLLYISLTYQLLFIESVDRLNNSSDTVVAFDRRGGCCRIKWVILLSSFRCLIGEMLKKGPNGPCGN